MVKYLSDQRNDPYYQTKLSLSQPLSSEVAAEIYPVDEVDLTPSLNMIETGARAYYAHQGEELERENMNISFSMYQAGKAKESAQKAAAEKEKGLKNTMLNDYAIAVSREVLDPYMQGDGRMSPVAAERKLRDIREQYIRMTGGVLNASDLMKIEKDSGVTFTKDLYNADLQRQNEAYKKDIEDFDKAADANFEQVFGEGTSSGVDRKTKNQMYANTIGLYNSFGDSVQNDFTVSSTSSDPLATPGSYMSNTTRKSFGDIVSLSLQAIKENALRDEDPEYLSANQLLNVKRLVTDLAKNRVVNVNGQPVKMSALYSDGEIEGVVNMAWKYSGIEAPYTDEQKRRKEFAAYIKDKADIKQDRNKMLEADIKRNELIAKANLQDNLSPTGLYLLENANILMNLDTIDPQKSSALRNLLEGSINMKNTEGYLGPVSEGRTMRDVGNKAMKVVDPQTGIAIKSANVEAGRRALNNQPTDGYVPYSIWDVPSAHAAMEDRENTLLRGDEIPSDPNTEQKQKNTELHRDLYLKARRNSEIWESLSREEQEDMTRSYSADTFGILRRGFNLLREKGLSENIAYDTKRNEFVPINYTGLSGSEDEVTLWKVIDNMNNATHTGLSELDKVFTDSQRTWVRDVTDKDRINQKSATASLGEALFGSDVVDTRKAISKLPGSVLEGMQRVGTAAWEAGKWLSEKGSEGAVLSAMFGFNKAKEAGEAIADIVNVVTDPNRSFIEETADGFSEAVLSNSKLSKDEKEKAKEDFREQVKAVKDVLTQEGELFGDSTISWQMPGKEVLGKVADAIESIDVKWDIPGKALFNTLKNLFVGRKDLPTIPPYNAGIITRIMQEDETVTPEEAKAALMAYNQASMRDKIRLNADFNIGYLNKNVEQRLKEAAENKKSIISTIGEAIIPSAGAAELPQEALDLLGDATPYPLRDYGMNDEEIKQAEKEQEERKEYIKPIKDESIDISEYSIPSFEGQYNTRLPEKEEIEFLQWARKNNLLKDLYDYDLRGAWKAGETPDKNGHLPDKWKKPNHPTFSNESIYASKRERRRWEGNKYIVPYGKFGKEFEQWLIRYFEEFEPNAELVFEK